MTSSGSISMYTVVYRKSDQNDAVEMMENRMTFNDRMENPHFHIRYWRRTSHSPPWFYA